MFDAKELDFLMMVFDKATVTGLKAAMMLNKVAVKVAVAQKHLENPVKVIKDEEVVPE